VEPTTVEEALALLKDRPNDAELYQHLGGLYAQRRMVMEAWEAYMQSLRLNPDDPFTCLKFGTLLMICADKNYARELFDRAIALEPHLAAAHWCSGALYKKQGDSTCWRSVHTNERLRLSRPTSRRCTSLPSGEHSSTVSGVQSLHRLQPNEELHLTAASSVVIQGPPAPAAAAGELGH